MNDIFTTFDRISDQFGVERIKTLGDAFLAVSSMPESAPDHAPAVVNCAVRVLRHLEWRNRSYSFQWEGATVGSVVGVQTYVYDVLWPAVNTAARL